MSFELVHAVGTRERWKVRRALTTAEGERIADQVVGIAGVTGVRVNPRAGSVILTVDSWAAKARTRAYFESLGRPSAAAVCSPAADAANAAPALSDRRIHLGAGLPVRASTPAARVAAGLVDVVERGFTGMPIFSLWAQVKRILGSFLPLGGGTARIGQSGGSLALERSGAELDFSPLARYVFLRPALPILVNAANAVLGALPILAEGVKNLFKGKLNVEVLDAAAIGVSLLRRDFRTVGLLVVLLGLGDMLEKYTRKKSLDSLADQLALKVDEVWVRAADGTPVKAQLADVKETDRVIVRAGSVIPVDGVVLSGDAAVNQASMTGEPLPVHRTEGGTVFAGTVVESGEIDVRPTARGGATRLSKIVQFIEASESVKAGIQGKAERLADAVVPYNLALAALVFLATRDWTRTASVLLVDYSCALRLATPLAILTAMRTGTQKGVLVKGGRYLEALAQADTVVFDKTGTLTKANPKLTDVVPLTSDFNREEVLRLAACLEEHFPHPVSRAVVDAALEEKVYHEDEAHDAQVRYVVAHGICSSVKGAKVVLGSRHFVQDDEGVDVSGAIEAVKRLGDEGKSILYMAVGGRLVGVLGIEDPVRPQAREAIAALRERGIKRIVMLTGDDERTAKHVADELGLDDYRAQVLPEDKAKFVAEIKKGGAKVLMVGDGINDSPALSAADVGVTLRDGTDIAQEVADVVLTENRLSDLPAAIDLGRAAMRRIKQNFVVSVGLNTAFLAGGLAGRLTPAAGALLHNATTVGVCLNAMSSPLAERAGFSEVLHDIADNLSHHVDRVERTLSLDQAGGTQA